ncbi:MAG: HAMP domain-containing histidine kinase [Solirubrobacteraceae bacterium]|nr:HAMP domain-containing histidine kinase [Solirubrobacteraceae bacterium]
MNRLGLRARVTLVWVGVLLVSIVALGAAGNALLRHTLNRDATVVLKARADALLATVAVEEGEVVVRDGPLADAPAYQTWVFTADGTVASPPSSYGTNAFAKALSDVTEPRETTTPSGTVRLLAEPIKDPATGEQLAVGVVGLLLLPYQRTEERALIGTALFGLLVLLIGAGLAWRAVGAALAPVAQMARDAGEWSEHDLDRRFGLGPAHDELTGLAVTLDGLLERIAASRRQEQRFSAEMAHEVRTPLAALRGEAELLRRRSEDPAAVTAGVDAVLAHADRMAEVVDVLMRSVHDEQTVADGTGDAVGAARRVVDASDSVAADQGIELSLVASATVPSVGAPAELIERALQPLVDNALRYARSRVVVSASERGGDVWLAVADDGPGVPQQLAGSLLEPGVRSEDSPGVGLGLALARRLATSCDGHLDVDPHGGLDGGALLSLRLPAVR